MLFKYISHLFRILLTSSAYLPHAPHTLHTHFHTHLALFSHVFLHAPHTFRTFIAHFPHVSLKLPTYSLLASPTRSIRLSHLFSHTYTLLARSPRLLYRFSHAPIHSLHAPRKLLHINKAALPVESGVTSFIDNVPRIPPYGGNRSSH